MRFIKPLVRLIQALVVSNYLHEADSAAVVIKVKILTIAVSLALTLNSCFLKQDRTTTVYGTITDQNGEPVDSILVGIDGVKGFTYERLKQVFSAKNGNYELVIEVPKKHGSTTIIIPFGLENPKFEKGYKGFNLSKNDVSTKNCCFSSIGEKTKYDFQLIPK